MIMCEPCNGKGWLVCDFCKGQKTNVKADNKRIYRRCPSCRAVCNPHTPCLVSSPYSLFITLLLHPLVFFCCRLDMSCVQAVRSSNVSLSLISMILLIHDQLPFTPIPLLHCFNHCEGKVGSGVHFVSIILVLKMDQLFKCQTLSLHCYIAKTLGGS